MNMTEKQRTLIRERMQIFRESCTYIDNQVVDTGRYGGHQIKSILAKHDIEMAGIMGMLDMIEVNPNTIQIGRPLLRELLGVVKIIEGLAYDEDTEYIKNIRSRAANLLDD